jgi:hypothetical protein
VVVVGQTVVVCAALITPVGSLQLNVYCGGPVGVNLQASLVAVHVPKFLPGGQTATVAAAFCMPTIPFPLFQVTKEKLFPIYTSIKFVLSYKTH